MHVFRFISPKPNTYVFSKAVAEAAIDARPGRTYSTAIVRPSIGESLDLYTVYINSHFVPTIKINKIKNPTISEGKNVHTLQNPACRGKAL